MRKFSVFLICSILVLGQVTQIPQSAGGGSGTVTNTGTLTSTDIVIGNGGVDVKVTGASIDSNNKITAPGGIDVGTGSGKTGYTLFSGKTSGSVGFTVSDVAGTQILYVLPTSVGSTGDVLSINSSTTCPDMPSGAPTNCRKLIWNAAASGAAGISPSAYASLPACSTTAAAYVLTDSYYNIAYCDGASVYHYYVDGKEVTRPTAASTWTLVAAASGIATKADSVGAVVLTTTAAVNGAEALLKAVPSAPYTRTFLLSIYGSLPASPAGGQGLNCGVLWTDGTANTNAIHALRIGSEAATPVYYTQVASYSSFAWAGASSNFAGYQPYFNPTKFWLRLQDNNTNRIFFISSDGVNWQQLYSVGRTSPFTPTHYGVFCGDHSGTGSLFTLTLLADE